MELCNVMNPPTNWLDVVSYVVLVAGCGNMLEGAK